jgi:adenylate kinase family enzyme
VSVVGASGSGKSTFARRLAAHLGVGHVELDALYWGPGWTPRPHEDFVSDVEAAVAGDAWVIDGNYSVLQPAIWARADTVVWIDPPTPLVLAQVYRRTLRFAIDQTELWPGTGLRQPWTDVLAPWKRDSIVRWSLQQRRNHPRRYGDAMTSPTNAHLTFHRLRSRREVEAFFDGTVRAEG